MRHRLIVATGLDHRDGLAGGVLAIDQDAPIIHNDGVAPRADVETYLTDQDSSKVYILGGENAAPASVESELADLGFDVERLFGADRNPTAVAVAEKLKDLNPGEFEQVTAVNRFGYANALTAAPLSVNDEAPILLVAKDAISTVTAEYHVDNCATIDFISAIGRTDVNSDAVVAAAVVAATCVDD